MMGQMDSGGMAMEHMDSGGTGMSGMSMPGMRMMPRMRAHMDSMMRMSPRQMQATMALHQGMMSQMMDGMGAEMRGMKMSSTPKWNALTDSVKQDLTDLANLKGQELSARMRGHADRVKRLLRTAGLPTTQPTIAVGRDGRTYLVDASRLLRGVPEREREAAPDFDLPTITGGRLSSGEPDG